MPQEKIRRICNKKECFKWKTEFKEKLCTTNAMYALVVDTQFCMENNEKYIGVFLDFTKAFDTVHMKTSQCFR